MRPTAKRVLLTGTTSGIGRALLEHYARGGAQVIAVNRRRVAGLEAQFPSVRFECVDVRDAEAVDSLLRALAAAGELPEVCILNAGINRVDNDDGFALAPFREVLETNLYGVLGFVEPLTRLCVPCHVVAISSLAIYAGNPYALGYSTSKRALTACFEAWARMYAGTDLVFQQVLLGPVPTAIYTMVDRLPAWMVRIRQRFSASPDGTARAIARFASTRKPTLVYPLRALPLFLALRWAQRLIPGFFQGRKTLDGKVRRPGP
jgi:NAD(P)-dependent dehydrogenase (short-subunit alcohol dehydrogenase family)